MNVAEMTLKKTCEMCPEQYDVLDRQGNTIAYMRLRHGYFEVTCPDVGGTVVYAANTEGDGCFYDDDEKALHIGAAVLAIERYYAPGRWISVEERLPEEGRDVLVSVDGGIGISHIICNDMVTDEPMWTYTGLGADPEYWQPLPEPPKED